MKRFQGILCVSLHSSLTHLRPVGAERIELRDHLDLLSLDGLIDRGGGGEDGDLLLLVPELGLLRLESIMQLGILMPQFELLMTDVQDKQGQRDAAE
jgi:hypothetical protein